MKITFHNCWTRRRLAEWVEDHSGLKRETVTHPNGYQMDFECGDRYEIVYGDFAARTPTEIFVNGMLAQQTWN